MRIGNIIFTTIMWKPACKLLQRKTISVLSHKYGVFCIIAGCVLVFVSAFQFGEVALEWSKENYAAVFNSFSDNIAGQSFRKRLCLPVPIDIVYTWVNGTDPRLLADLRRYKLQLEQELRNDTRLSTGECTFNDCVEATMVILQPALLPGVTIADFIPENAIYSQTVQTFKLEFMIRNQLRKNVTVVMFDSVTDVVTALKQPKLRVHRQNFTIKKAYYTSDWVLPNSKTLKNQILVTGLPSGYDEDKVKALFPAKLTTSLTKVETHDQAGVAVLTFGDSEEADKLQHINVTIAEKAVTVTLASLVWDLNDYSHNEDIAASRFEDNEELRYSLRSVEKFAPWVRHVFIVTNGQIPSWLNLASPRVTLVTHQELFINKSHLPTFGSPAIESHLHRIPGLSDKFIYMNDDVMFGKEVWPDDFYTHANGQKVYLTWPVPSCRDGCPSTWIKDGYCDKACNNSDCDWDGGDCEGKTASNIFGGVHPNLGDYYSYTGAEYCSTGCANNWVADRYCDPSCNVKACGFDAGDCGSSNFHELPMYAVHRDTTHYSLQQGDTVVYFNMTQLFGLTGHINNSYYEKNDVIRTVAIAQKLKVMTLLLFPKYNATTLKFFLEGKHTKENIIQFNFTVSVDTRKLNKTATNGSAVVPLLEDKSAKKLLSTTTKKTFEFENIPPEKLSAKPRIDSEENTRLYLLLDMSEYLLPNDTETQLNLLIQQLNNGDLTRKGFLRAQARLWQTFVKQLRQEGKEPVRAPPKKILSVPGASAKGNISLKHPSKDYKIHSAEDNHKKTNFGDNRRLQVDKNNPVQNQENREMKGVKLGAVDSEKLGRKGEPGNMDVAVPKEGGQNLRKDVIRQTNDGKKESVDDGRVVKRRTKQFKTRDLKGIDGEEKLGFLPWEKQGIFDSLQKKRDSLEKQRLYSDTVVPRRHLLDTYADSLRHVNHIYNLAFGYTARKVPAHMPHFIDRNIMAELQGRFPQEWDVTSSHKIRSSTDMQFAFSYFYFLMGQIQNVSASEIFLEMDTDHSGALSDREIRTLATRLFDLPLDLQTLTKFESIFINCSKQHDTESDTPLVPGQEVYYDKHMPQVTRVLFTSCEPLVELVKTKFSSRNKYKFELLNDDEVVFKMLQSNSSHIVGQLDDIRKHPKKFICLNDNIAHGSKESATVKAVLRDFYESLFPIPSTFELPRHYRNRFQYLDQVHEWTRYLEKLKRWTTTALAILIVFTIISFFFSKIQSLWRRVWGRHKQVTPLKKQRSSHSKSPPSLSLISV